ncbi:MAG: M12 family metallo-peptidase [Bacteroidia bacterium]|nr:M12 family metallo-peptidase [Bacteroidia bacterium]
MQFLRLVTLMSCLSGLLHAQVVPSYWSARTATDIPVYAERLIQPDRYLTTALDVPVLKQTIAGAPLEPTSAEPTRITAPVVSLPMPDGSFQTFRVYRTEVMHPDLAARYPEIMTWSGVSVDRPSTRLRMDITPAGLHAMVIAPGEVVFIDPAARGLTDLYLSYYKKDLTSKAGLDQMVCDAAEDIQDRTKGHDHPEMSSGDELRTYRLALACTGEYSQFHGGTVSGALAAMVTSVNRVNGVYEQEVGVRMVLIPNNDQLIFLNAATDPYTNNDGGAMLGQNQTTITSIIGAANYDIGHVYSTGGGGVAFLGSVCTGNKARGVTGSPAPVGDPFDIDFVAHEMGHQFGGNHTFNGTSGACNGNRAGNAAYEPGSGTTIMAYAGICSPQNLQPNSDAYFHTKSFDEIYTFIHTGAGNNCPVITQTGNQAPVVDAGTSGYVIPISTPFVLTGSATDPDGDTLTYCWEQYNLGPAGAPNNPSGDAPIFRSFNPVASSSRTFPRLSSLLNNVQQTGEILPTYARTLNFRLTARDNKPGGGGVSYDGTSVIVTDLAGPFLVTQPNTAVSLTGGTAYEVKWDVANTNLAPVLCKTVTILLSFDGGNTYPDTLASQIANAGSQVVLLPAQYSNTCRIKVQADDNIFFDISDRNFSIVQPTAPGFTVFPLTNSLRLCPGDSATLTALTTQLLSFTDPIAVLTLGLPTGVTAVLSADTITAGDTILITFYADTAIASGTTVVSLAATSPNAAPSLNLLQLETLAGTPLALTAAYPQNGATRTSRFPTFSWTPGAAGDTYEIEIASSPAFGASTLITASNLAVPNFTPDTEFVSQGVFYWRVRAYNYCGAGAYSEVSAFQTSFCIITNSTDVPKTIPLFGSPILATSTVNAQLGGPLESVHVLNVRGTHVSVSQLSGRITSPAGTVVPLFGNSCTEDDENFAFSFSDQAAPGAIPCPPTSGAAYKPVGSLDSLAGENAFGIWTLTLEDNANFDNGQLNGWALEICIPSGTNILPDKNGPLPARRWNIRTVTDTFLAVNDPVGIPSGTVYTLITLPVNGVMRLNGDTLDIGATFTQEDINQLKLDYAHDGTLTLADSFRYAVQNQFGGWLGTPTFQITVLQTTDIDEPGLGTALTLFPVPADEVLAIRLGAPVAVGVTLSLLDMQGRQVLPSVQLTYGETTYDLDISRLASGLYLLDVVSAAGREVRKVVVE